jgi:glucose-6-phosphate isomerase
LFLEASTYELQRYLLGYNLIRFIFCFFMPSLSLCSTYVDAYIASKKITVPMSLFEAHESLQNKTCVGSDFLGWIDLPATIQDSIVDIQATAERLQAISDVLVVC